MRRVRLCRKQECRSALAEPGTPGSQMFWNASNRRYRTSGKSMRSHASWRLRSLWTKDFSGGCEDLLTIEDQIYNNLVTALELKPSDEELTCSALRPTENEDAYELDLKGRDILRGKRRVQLSAIAE